MNGVIIPYTSMTEGARVIVLCEHIAFHGNSSLEDSYTASICSKQGKWEPNPSSFCANTTGITTSINAILTTMSCLSIRPILQAPIIISRFVIPEACQAHP